MGIQKKQKVQNGRSRDLTFHDSAVPVNSDLYLHPPARNAAGCALSLLNCRVDSIHELD